MVLGAEALMHASMKEDVISLSRYQTALGYLGGLILITEIFLDFAGHFHEPYQVSFHRQSCYRLSHYSLFRSSPRRAAYSSESR